MITVVAALIEKDDKIFIAKRATGKSAFGKWEFPGGKVESNETEENAIEREIKEEFDVIIKAQKFIINNICQTPERVIDLRLYECKYLTGEFQLHDHFEYEWVEIDKLLEYDLADADIPLAKYVKENYEDGLRKIKTRFN